MRLWYVRLANARQAAWDTSLFSTGINATSDGIVSVKNYLVCIITLFRYFKLENAKSNAKDGIVSVIDYLFVIYFIYTFSTWISAISYGLYL